VAGIRLPFSDADALPSLLAVLGAISHLLESLVRLLVN